MIALTVVRAIHFAVSIQAIGALLFVWIIDRTPEVAAYTVENSARWLMRAAAVSAAAVALSAIAWLVLQAADMTDRSAFDAWTSGAVDTLLFETQAGVIWVVRFALATALIVDMGVLTYARRAPSQAAIAAGFALAVGSFVSCTWLSHAGADPSPYRSLHLAVHASHMFGVALWFGGFMPLAMLLSRALKSGDATDAAVARHAGVWFGNIALFAVGLILVTGIANAVLLVDNASDLTTGLFARLLAAKIVLFLFMLVLAAMNRQWLVPELAAAANPSIAATLLWRSVLGELALAAFMLLIVGELGITSLGADGG